MTLQWMYSNNRIRVFSAAILTALLLGGCATGPNVHPRDPLEPWNRQVFRFNEAIDRVFSKPVATTYTKVTPEFVRKGVSNFFGNMVDAWSMVNSLLQFKGQEAGNSFFRVVTNTVFGLGGIFDVATEAQIPRVKQDFGLTLGNWGVPSGPYLVLPVLGASTIRDTVALPVDLYGNPLSAFIDNAPVRNSLYGVGFVSYRAEMLPVTRLLDQTAVDSYVSIRDAYLQQRDARIDRVSSGQIDQGVPSDGYEPTLQELEQEQPQSVEGAAVVNEKHISSCTPMSDSGGCEPSSANSVASPQAAASSFVPATSMPEPETQRP